MANVTIGGFNTGIQRSWIIIDNVTQLPVNLGGDILDLTATEVVQTIEINPISNQGYPKYKTDWKGWKGTITVARNNNSGDLFEAAQELLYHSGGTQHYFTIRESTINDSGSIDVMQYTGCEFHMEDAGTAKKDSAIEMKFAFTAQGRQPSS